MVVIILCSIIVYVVIRNAKQVAQRVADKTARLLVQKLFEYRMERWTYMREKRISNEDMQKIIEEVRDAGSKL